MSNLLIVESPNKCKSIQSYLGTGWRVMASFGHVRALLQKGKGIDVENNFQLNYSVSEDKKKQVADIIRNAKDADTIWLATDPDREGEAIAWHLSELLREAKIKAKIVRVTFNEITKTAVQEAVKFPRELDMNLVHAQQGRAALDYLVGFTLSPLLWSKVANGTSAGRVQSPGLKIVDDRDTEIKAFTPEEYWTIYLKVATLKKESFNMRLSKVDGETLGKMGVKTKEEADKLIDRFNKQSIKISSIKKGSKTRKPHAPFTTSTLQMDAARKLGFSSKRTMDVAQKLFEGVTIDGQPTGLITYMRTDSVTLSNDALTDIQNYIRSNMSEEYWLNQPNVYKSKAKNAQEAHEAIRPTYVKYSPDSIRAHLNDDMYKLYKLIWLRTVASQLPNAEYDTVSVEALSEDQGGLFKVSGSTLKVPGFLTLYDEGKDVDEESDDNVRLPELTEATELSNEGLSGKQTFTKPPAKLNEATLVKTMEELGIGRPSTYASIISTLQTRGYVTLEQKRFSSTAKGHAVNAYLSRRFSKYVGFEFTAYMEDQLDEIANGRQTYLAVLNAFWNDFIKDIQTEKSNSEGTKGILETLDETCPECKEHKLVKRFGKYGTYISCGGYPKCKYIRKDEQAKKPEAEIVEGKMCPECGNHLVKKKGFKGREFIGCSNYPTCKYIEGRTAPKDTGRTCPSCKKHNLVERQTKFGTMIACSGFPKCRYIEGKDKKAKGNNKSSQTPKKKLQASQNVDVATKKDKYAGMDLTNI